MAYDSTTGQLVLFGGHGSTGGILGDTWTWNGTTWTQEHPATSPPARDFSSMADDPASHQLILFGGFNGGVLNDTWNWTGTNWTQQTPATSPSARQSASMAYSSEDGGPVLFGGQQGDGSSLNDTWAWNGTTWVRDLAPASVQPRESAAMDADPTTGQLFLFGGEDSASDLFGDTWVYGVAPPTVPVIGTAAASNTQATLTFNPSTFDGGSPVTSYTVSASTRRTPHVGDRPERATESSHGQRADQRRPLPSHGHRHQQRGDQPAVATLIDGDPIDHSRAADHRDRDCGQRASHRHLQSANL